MASSQSAFCTRPSISKWWQRGENGRGQHACTRFDFRGFSVTRDQCDLRLDFVGFHARTMFPPRHTVVITLPTFSRNKGSREQNRCTIRFFAHLDGSGRSPVVTDARVRPRLSISPPPLHGEIKSCKRHVSPRRFAGQSDDGPSAGWCNRIGCANASGCDSSSALCRSRSKFYIIVQ